MDFFNVTPLDKAKQIFKTNFSLESLGSSVLPLAQAIGKRCYSDVISPESLPDFNRSTVDGYAVKSANTYGATDSIPALLRLVGKVKMGEANTLEISSGETVYVPTGGAIPKGADAMVMLEYTETMADKLAIFKPCTVGENIIKIGDDFIKGSVVTKKGNKITYLNAGVLASIGVAELKVYNSVKVAVISTGDEIVEIDKKTQIGQIRNTNSTINSALCQQEGFEIVSDVLLPDNFESLDFAVLDAVKRADIVLISGGSSIGSKDFTEKVLAKEGEILAHGLALKPGKPTIMAKVKGKMVVGLPGHPMACLLTLRLLVLDAVAELFGDTKKPFVYAVTTTNLPSSAGRLTVQPVKLSTEEDIVYATPLFYKSGLVSVLAEADGYFLIEPNQEGVYKNQRIKVFYL